MDGAPKQISLLPAERGLARHYRIGPGNRSYTDPSYSHSVEAFEGIGLRPLSVCHIRARRALSGNHLLSWTRRTRVDGDSWASFEVPLGELRELYLVRVYLGAVLKREVMVGSPDWSYSATMKVADGTAGQAFRIEVAQISDAFGAGPFRGVEIDD